MSDVSAPPRPPTRCPMCKGAVIERQPGAAHGSFVWFHCLFCNHWWKFRLDDPYVTPKPSPNGELSGDVFIVRKGGTKHALDSVAVNAIPEDALKKHLESKTLESEKLQLQIDRLTGELAVSQADDDRLWKLYQADTGNAENSDAWLVAYNKSKEVTKQLTAFQSEQRHLTSREFFFEGLPAAIATAETDEDGKFTLVIPREGRFGVVARASRELLMDTETYFWFVWVSLDGEHSKRLVLNDENMMGAGSPDSAVQ